VVSFEEFVSGLFLLCFIISIIRHAEQDTRNSIFGCSRPISFREIASACFFFANRVNNPISKFNPLTESSEKCHVVTLPYVWKPDMNNHSREVIPVRDACVVCILSRIQGQREIDPTAIFPERAEDRFQLAQACESKLWK
jgi:hypothetical protein